MAPRVLVTRAPHQGSALADQLRARGLEPVLIPAIEIAPPASYVPLDDALTRLHSFDWLLFTSANAVQVFAQRSTATALPPIAVIGPATASAATAAGFRVTLVSPQAVAESLTEALLSYARRPGGAPARFLLLRAEQGREHLPETLRGAGAEVTVVSAYRTIIPAGSVLLLQSLFAAHAREQECDHGRNEDQTPNQDPNQDRDRDPRLAAITFTSSSSARNLLALCEAAGVHLPASALRLSIGPVTTETLRVLGHPPHAEAPEATVAALAEITRQTLEAHGLQ